MCAALARPGPWARAELADAVRVIHAFQHGRCRKAHASCAPNSPAQTPSTTLEAWTCPTAGLPRLRPAPVRPTSPVAVRSAGIACWAARLRPGSRAGAGAAALRPPAAAAPAAARAPWAAAARHRWAGGLLLAGCRLGAPAAWPAARRRPPAAPAAWPARQRAASGPWAARGLRAGHQWAGGPEPAAAPTAALGRRAAAAPSRAAAAAGAAGAGRPAAPRPRLSGRCPRAAPTAPLPQQKAGARPRRRWPDPSAATRRHPTRHAPVRGAHGPL
jgi:hypothetical protein